MAVVYRDFLDEAKVLFDSPDTEIRVRNCVVLGYYSLYHSARIHADEVHTPQVSSQAGPVHKNLRSFYIDNLYPDKALQSKMKRVGYALKVLHENRCRADYELSVTISPMDADAHLQRCELAIGIVEALRANAAA